VWHLPGLYQAALGNNLVHSLEHLCFFGGGLIFWWTLFQPDEHKRPKFAASILYVLTTALSSTGLGALMTIAVQPWYPIYSTTASTWGLAPLDDQQLAGLVVWVSSGAIYVIAASALFVLWLDRLERDMRHQALVSLNSQALPPSYASMTVEPGCGGAGGNNVQRDI
jgi:putative membrane protein